MQRPSWVILPGHQSRCNTPEATTLGPILVDCQHCSAEMLCVVGRDARNAARLNSLGGNLQCMDGAPLLHGKAQVGKQVSPFLFPKGCPPHAAGRPGQVSREFLAVSDTFDMPGRNQSVLGSEDNELHLMRSHFVVSVGWQEGRTSSKWRSWRWRRRCGDLRRLRGGLG